MSRDMTTTGPTLGQPQWCGDPMSPDRLFRGPTKIDATKFHAPDAVKVVVGAAGAAAAATAVPVAALSGPIPDNTLLDFGTNKFARLSAASPVNDTSLATDAIPTALVSGDTAWYEGLTGRKTVPSGTVVSRNTETAKWEPAVDGHLYIGILAFDVWDADDIDDAELVRSGMGTMIKKNYLPGTGWAGLSATVQAKLRAEYNITEGTD